MTDHHGEHHPNAYTVTVQGVGVVWHGMDHTKAMNAWERYVADARLPSGKFHGRVIDLCHKGKLIHNGIPAESIVEVLN